MNSYIKRFAGTIIAFVVFILLLASVLLFDKEKHIETKLEKVFPSMNTAEISSIRMKSAGREFVLEKGDEGWTVQIDSKKLKAAKDIVDDLIKNVKDMEVEKLVTRDSSKLKDYGIVASVTEFSVKTKDTEYPLIIGDQSPIGSGVYVYDLGEGRVIIVKYEYLQGFMKKNPEDLRDRKILTFDKESVNSIIFKVGGFSADLMKEKGKWVEVMNLDRHTADRKKIREIIDSYSEMKTDGFPDDKPLDLDKYGLVNPTAEIKFYAGGKEVAVLFGKRKDEENYYVKLSNADPVYSVSKKYFNMLPKNNDEVLGE
ncbi:MAG: DUF4340 domain-containing protein [Thermodesulfobacteriota bacterium]